MSSAGGSTPGDDARDDAPLVAAALDAMLPKGLAVLSGVDLAASCVVGADPMRRGGDWFDTVPLGGGRVAAIVGDAPGTGLAAVAAMSQLRSVLAAALLRTGEVEAALLELDAYTARVPEARASTVVVAVLDPGAGAVSYCTAGHPPPLVVPVHGAPTFLEPTGAGPLGRGSGSFPTRTADWAADEALLLFSDGLLDNPMRARGGGTVALATAADECRADTGMALVEALVRRLPMVLTDGRANRDDLIMVAAQRRAQPLADLRLDLPATGEALLTVRGELDAWLAPLVLSAIDAMSLQHAVGELLANVVQHAYAGRPARGRMRVHATVTDRATVEVEVQDDGTWRSTNGHELLPVDGGRGLNLARLLTDQLQLVEGSEGTTVRLGFEPQRPVSMYTAPTRAQTRHRRPLKAEVRSGALALSGPLDLNVADDLRQLLGRASLGSTRDAEVDLSDVDVLDSIAVQVILDAQQASEGNGRSLTLVAARGTPAQQVLDLVRVSYRPPLPPDDLPG
jgi:anti-sigma regulatory factor (Ser/Thr protein kinase)/anti-anti-sigma regulatory factor